MIPDKWQPYPYPGKLAFFDDGTPIICKRCINQVFELEESQGQICKHCADEKAGEAGRLEVQANRRN